MRSPDIAICVPRRSDGGTRDMLWRWVRSRLERLHPEWPIVEGHHENGRMNRAAARNTAARLARPWDVAVFFDADCFAPPAQVAAAADQAAESGQMVVASTTCRLLSRAGTANVLAGRPARTWHLKREMVAPSGCFAVPSSLWDEVGGQDERFVGWGFEDRAFLIACATLAGVERIAGPMWHLWHPIAADKRKGDPGYEANLRLVGRYKAANGDVAAVRQILAERHERR
jgi:hypothetical protein